MSRSAWFFCSAPARASAREASLACRPSCRTCCAISTAGILSPGITAGSAEAKAELQELIPGLAGAHALDGSVDPGRVGERALHRLRRDARRGGLHRALPGT